MTDILQGGKPPQHKMGNSVPVVKTSHSHNKGATDTRTARKGLTRAPSVKNIKSSPKVSVENLNTLT